MAKIYEWCALGPTD